MSRFCLIISSCFLICSCITPKKEKRLKSDIFNLQTRLLKLERSQQEQSESNNTQGKAAAKQIATTSSQLQKINLNLRQLNGEVDTIKAGFETGDLPGQPEGKDSVGKLIRELTLRVDVLEQTISDLQSQTTTSNSSKKKRKPIKSFNELKSAYEDKRYLHVVEDITSLLGKLRGASKEEAQFIQAESLYRLGRLRDAAIKYSDFVDKKPNDKYLPHSKLRLGDCFRHLGDHDAAKLYYKEVIVAYSSSKSAEIAKERLDKILSSAEKS